MGPASEPVRVDIKTPTISEPGDETNSCEVWGIEAQGIIRRNALEFEHFSTDDHPKHWFKREGWKAVRQFKVRPRHEGRMIHFYFKNEFLFRAQMTTAYRLHRQGMHSAEENAEGRDGLLLVWNLSTRERSID